MGILNKINSPRDLKPLSVSDLNVLSAEIRRHLVNSISQTGGHLGSNLGVVELTLALHKVFDSPKDSVLFDVGHQSYVHKLLTGRKSFRNFKNWHGLTGYPSRAESKHDILENSHASTSLSWGLGIATANRLNGNAKSKTVVVVGDGALTGGMAWEALNNIAVSKNEQIVIIINDNGRSYADTIGGLSQHLQAMSASQNYANIEQKTKQGLLRLGVFGKFLKRVISATKIGVKHLFIPKNLFSELGIPYIGPVDGHNIRDLLNALNVAKHSYGPIIVHAITTKGKGYSHAENNEMDNFHAIGKFNPQTGNAIAKKTKTWTSVFGDEIYELARKNKKIVAITAAMLEPVGLEKMNKYFPERVFDVGISEQHAVSLAAGLSYKGFHPFVAIYSTFALRAFDQLLMDIALHGETITLVLDRAGITGNDATSHNGVFDFAVFSNIPHIKIATPYDKTSLLKAINYSINQKGHINVIRYPKCENGESKLLEKSTEFKENDTSHTKNGSISNGSISNNDAIDSDVINNDAMNSDIINIVKQTPKNKVLLINYGPFLNTCLKVHDSLLKDGIHSAVISPLWAYPFESELLDFINTFELVVTVEDAIIEGGIGQKLSISAKGIEFINIGVSNKFLKTADRDFLIKQEGMNAESILAKIRTAY
jgi:1-deoxy-D-xylulose-5-phosphate synthase